MSTTSIETQFVSALSFQELKETGCKTVQLNGHTIVIWYVNKMIYALDNRCPHMGFPLDKGSVKDGLLTCHWHHARFDLESGGTFDQWADDVRAFPTELREGYIWVDLARYQDPKIQQRERLHVSLERNISLVNGKAAITLLDDGGDPVEPFRIGLQFGTTYRWSGWGQGLTMLTCLLNMLPYLDEEDRPRALYQGLTAVSADTIGSSPRFLIRPLPNQETDIPTLKQWFRRFIEVRDSEGAERCIVSAIRAGATAEQMADMLFTAVTDHRYIQLGHPADFTNKAFEALDIVGWEDAEIVLTSLVNGYANAPRMEESNAWRNPIDLIEILHGVFAQLETMAINVDGSAWNGRNQLIPIVLSDNPQTIVAAMLEALKDGCTMHQLAATISYAAALRIAHFHTSNEFGDWDTALHTFTFANAIQQGLRRAPSVELLRGVFDAAMSIYLDRFLNIPEAKIPLVNKSGPNGRTLSPADTLATLPHLLDKQQQVTPAAQLVVNYLGNSGNPKQMLAMLGKLLLREDRDFHTIQTVEAAFRQFHALQGTEAGTHLLVAAARYLAAHSPTVRAQEQTYQIAARLHRGDHPFAAD